MAHFVKVARLAHLPPGAGMMVVGPFDKPMALFNVRGEVFAINAVCPHRGGPLANGRLDGHGVDIARSGLAKAERLACARGVRARWVCGDIGGLAERRLGDGSFDLIYSCGSVHYVPRGMRGRLFRRLQALTRTEGLHAHIVFTDLAIYMEKGERIDYFTPGELAALYADWLIVACEKRLIDCRQDGTIHRHSVEQLVVRAHPRDA